MQLAAGCVSRAHAVWNVGLLHIASRFFFFFLLCAGGSRTIAMKLCFLIFCLLVGMICWGCWLYFVVFFCFCARCARQASYYLKNYKKSHGRSIFLACLLVGHMYAAGSWLREPRTCCLECRLTAYCIQIFFIVFCCVLVAVESLP